MGNPDRGWAIALFIPLACRNWTREHTHTGGLETAAEAGKKPGGKLGKGCHLVFNTPPLPCPSSKRFGQCWKGGSRKRPSLSRASFDITFSSFQSQPSHQPIVTHNNSPLLVVDAVVRILESHLFAYTYEHTPHLTSPVWPHFAHHPSPHLPNHSTQPHSQHGALLEGRACGGRSVWQPLLRGQQENFL